MTTTLTNESYITTTDDENEFVVARAIPLEREWQGTIGLSTVRSMGNDDENFDDEANNNGNDDDDDDDDDEHPFDEQPNDDLRGNRERRPRRQQRDNVHHHQCSSATCQICENRRQRGIQENEYRWLQTLAPASPERVPTYDPSRPYISDDTVQF